MTWTCISWPGKTCQWSPYFRAVFGGEMCKLYSWMQWNARFDKISWRYFWLYHSGNRIQPLDIVPEGPTKALAGDEDRKALAKFIVYHCVYVIFVNHQVVNLMMTMGLKLIYGFTENRKSCGLRFDSPYHRKKIDAWWVCQFLEEAWRRDDHMVEKFWCIIDGAKEESSYIYGRSLETIIVRNSKNRCEDCGSADNEGCLFLLQLT